MEITHLRYFKKTAELEHITKAAQELHVAQPSLSRTISMLEDELKVKLFNRKGKSIELNEYGIIVLNHTNRILKELEAIHREIDDARENSVMNVTFSMNAASTLIPRLVRGFKEEHSDIRLHILQEDLVEDSGQSCDLTLFAGSQFPAPIALPLSKRRFAWRCRSPIRWPTSIPSPSIRSPRRSSSVCKRAKISAASPMPTVKWPASIPMSSWKATARKPSVS